LRLMREQEAAHVILIDHEISPSQQFNLAIRRIGDPARTLRMR